MLHGVVVAVRTTAAGPDLPGLQLGLLGLSGGCHELAEGQVLLRPAGELGWWRGGHICLLREPGRWPAFLPLGWEAPEGSGSGGWNSWRDSDVVTGNAWRSEVSASCFVFAWVTQGTACPGLGSGKVSDSVFLV